MTIGVHPSVIAKSPRSSDRPFPPPAFLVGGLNFCHKDCPDALAL
jgi:hypothetical protein